MKKKKVIILSVLMFLLVAASVLGAFLMFNNEEVEKVANKANIEWYTEEGEEFVITTEEELYGLVKLSKYYDFSGQTIKLGADIVINDGNAKDWEEKAPAKWWYPIDGFAGTFDGQGHSISGIYGYGVDTKMGLFSDTKMNCVIKDLKVLNSYFKVDGLKSVGSVASNGAGTFEKLYSDAIITTNGENAGGIVGKINDDGIASATTRNSKMINCWFDGVVKLTTKTGRYGGGLVGQIYGGSLSISHCLNSGDISSECKETNGIYIGGIFGRMSYMNYSGAVTVEDTLNVGQIIAKEVSYTGSLAGGTLSNTTMSLKDTYVTEKSYSDVCSNQGSTTTGSAMMVNTDFIQGEEWYSWTTLNYDEYWTVTKEDTPILQCFAETVIDTSGLKKAYNTDWYNPYAKESIIDSVEDLYGFAIMSYFDNFANKVIKLGADIKVNEGKASAWANGKNIPENNWIPISRINHFQGVFDGSGHTISGLYGKSATAFVGLFGTSGVNSEIKNVKVMNSYFEAGGALGSIVARCEGKVDTAYSNAYLREHTYLAGGIVGYKLNNAEAKITNCWYDGVLVLGDKAKYCGGIIGRIINGTLEMNSCLFSGKMMIEGEKHSALSGGFIGGIAKGTITVNDCLNSGEIVLTEGGNSMPGVGRVFGYLSDSEKIIITITNSYFTDEGFNGTYPYYREGEKQTIKGGAEVKETESILGYDGYRTTSLDFKKYWTVVVNEDSTPILKSFAKKVPSVAGLEKNFDKSWYSSDKNSFVLTDAKDLYGFLYLSNSNIDFKGKKVVLANDIQLINGSAVEWADGKNIPGNAYNWSGIGKHKYFQGTFDGQGHTVSGLYGTTDRMYFGLFGYVGQDGVVKNLRLTNSYLESKVEGEDGAAIGSVVGRLEGNLDTVYSDAIIRSSSVLNGGIAGYKLLADTKSSITNSWYDGIIYMDGDTSGYTGGIVGRIINGEMELNNCLFSGKISIGGKKRSANTGGLVGNLNSKLVLKSCLNSGVIELTEAAGMTTTHYFVGVVGDKDTIQLVMDNVYAINNSGGRDRSYYTLAGDKATVEGGAEIKPREELLGYDGYRTTSLDFDKYWTVVVDEDSTPILKSFATEVPSVAGLEKTFDKSWYSSDKNSFVLKDAKDLYGFLYLSNSNIDFKGKKVVLANDIQLNNGSAVEWADGKNIPEQVYNWSGIGGYTSFQGTFDGQGHTVSGLYGTTDLMYFGFFDYVGKDGAVQDVRLTNSYFESTVEGDAGAAIGSVVGRLEGNLDTVYSDAIIRTSSVLNGGIAGYKLLADTKSSVTNTWYDGIIYMEGNDSGYTGGIAGRIINGEMELNNCLFSGKIVIGGKKRSANTGGLVGNLNSKLVLKSCLNSGVIELTEAAGMTTTHYFVGVVGDKDTIQLVMDNVYAINNSGGRDRSYYTLAGDKATIEGGAEIKVREELLGYDGYRTTSLDFDKYWTVVVNEDSTPILKSFATEVPSVAGLEKIFDKSWYSEDKDRFVLKDAKDLYGFLYLSNSDIDFKGKTITLGKDIVLNDGSASDWADGKNVPEKVYNWSGIGGYTNFQGTFDGQGHTVSGLYGTSDLMYFGFFDYVGKDGAVQDVRLTNTFLESTVQGDAGAAIGSIAGRLEGSLHTVYSDAIIRTSSVLNGGIAGYKLLADTKSSVTNTWYDGIIYMESDSSGYTGGIAGRIINGEMELNNCLFSGKIVIGGKKRSANTGGLVGNLNDKLVLKGCMNSGDIKLTEATGMTTTNYIVGLVGDKDVIKLVMEDVYAINNGDGRGRSNYTLAGDKATIEGGAEIKVREELLGYDGYRTTSLDFAKYWTVVVDEDSTPVLKSFAEEVPSVAGLEKIFDTSWYSEDKDRFELKDAKDLYGFLYLSNSLHNFKGKTIVLARDIELNDGKASDWADGKNIPETVYNWSGIGGYENFQGTFDGQGHTVSGLYGTTDLMYFGFFDYVGTNGTVKNVRLTNTFLESTVQGDAGAAIGSIAGRLEGNLHTVYSDAIIRTSSVLNGGIAGYKLSADQKSNITNTWYDGIIYMESDSSGYTGGIVGRIISGEMELNNCLFSGTITMGGVERSANTGGLVGNLNSKLVLNGCLNSGVIKLTDATKMSTTNYIVGQIQDKDTIKLVMENVYAINDGGGRERTYYTMAGDKPTIEGSAEIKSRGELLGYDGYRTTSLDFDKYWTVVVDEDSTPILKSFAEKVPSVAGLKKTFDTSWYSEDKDLFELKNAEELYGFLYLSNSQTDFRGKTITLGKDIVLNDGLASDWAEGKDVPGNAYNWSGIGRYTNFEGTFDGQGYTISGLYCNNSSDMAGFFACTGANSIIQNFDLRNSYISGMNDNGSIVARANGRISNVSSDAIVVGRGCNHGGIAGYASGNLTIENSYFEGNLSTTTVASDDGDKVGGIVGCVEDGTVNIESCYFSGNLAANTHYVGGIVGYMASADNINIKKCYVEGLVKSNGGNNVGGIIGVIIGTSATITMEDCLNKAQVQSEGGNWLGGLIGRIFNQAPTVNMTRCLNMGHVTGKGRVGSIVGQRYNDTINVVNVYDIKSSTATNTTYSSNVMVGNNGNNIDGVQPINLTDITVSNEVNADTIMTTTLSGLFGPNTIWTIGPAIGSTPELQLK